MLNDLSKFTFLFRRNLLLQMDAQLVIGEIWVTGSLKNVGMAVNAVKHWGQSCVEIAVFLNSRDCGH